MSAYGRLIVVLLSVVLFAGPSIVSTKAQSTRQTIDNVLPRVVKIFGAGGIRSLAAYGTGFLVSKEGHIVTVWSHVLDPDEVIVVLDDGRRFPAEVLGAEPPLDLAVLRIVAPDQELNLPHFNLESAIGSAGEGARVLAFSNMFKVATGDEPVSVLHGVVAAKTRLRARRGTFEIPYDGPVYIVDAITNNSGGAGGLLTSRDGKLLGMIGRELRNANSNTWVNYSIPLTELKKSIGEIISGRFTRSDEPPPIEEGQPRYDTRDFGIVLVPNVLFRTPAYVDAVLPGSPAAEAGIRPDDLVLFVNDELMQSVRTTRAEVGRLEAGDTLRLVLRRGDDLLTFEFPVPGKRDRKNADE